MTKRIFSAIESPTHPFLTTLYQQCGVEELCFKQMRKLIAKVKKSPPDFIAVEFFYGYGNNYAGINISNVDVLLYTLQRYAPETKVIIFMDKSERQYIDKLYEIFPIHAVFTYPINTQSVIAALK